MNMTVAHRSSRSPSTRRRLCACRSRSLRRTARRRRPRSRMLYLPIVGVAVTYPAQKRDRQWDSQAMTGTSLAGGQQGEGGSTEAHGGAPVAGPAIVDGDLVLHEHVGRVLEVVPRQVSSLHRGRKLLDQNCFTGICAIMLPLCVVTRRNLTITHVTMRSLWFGKRCKPVRESDSEKLNAHQAADVRNGVQ